MRAEPLSAETGSLWYRPAWAASVVIAGDVVEVLAAMFCERPELPNEFPAFVIFGWTLVTGEVTDIDRDVPVKRRRAIFPALLALANRIRQRFAAVLEVCFNVRIADGPKTKLFRRCFSAERGCDPGQHNASSGIAHEATAGDRGWLCIHGFDDVAWRRCANIQSHIAAVL